MMDTPIPEPPYRTIILGGRGHARMLIDCLQTRQHAIIHGVLVPDQALWGIIILDVPVLGGDELLPTLAA